MTSKGIDRIAVLGSSSSTGFGTGGRSYGTLVGQALGAGCVENLSKFGRTTELMVEEDLPLVAALSPDLVIVEAGMGDSLPHPGQWVQGMLERFAPKTWHGVEGLERRAYFRGTRPQRAQQWVTARAKTTLKRTLIQLTGGYTRATPAGFGEAFERLITELEGIAPVVVSVGMFDVDQHLFPKQHEMNLPFRQQRFAVLSGHQNVIAVEINQRLHQWADYHDDHAHWNASGHATVADEILQTLQVVPSLATAVPNPSGASPS
jgi:lysophospholipase L1-like esterase